MVDEVGEREVDPVEIHKLRDRPFDNASNVRVARATEDLSKMLRIVDLNK